MLQKLWVVKILTLFQAVLTACFLEQWAEAHWNTYPFFIDPQFFMTLPLFLLEKAKKCLVF